MKITSSEAKALNEMMNESNQRHRRVKRMGTMKKIMLALLFVLLSFSLSSADNPGDQCNDFANLYVDMNDSGGYVKVYYVDCEGKSQKNTFKHESGVVCVDTDYEILLVAIPYDDYEFIGWGDDDVWGYEVSMFLCKDLYLAPRFQEYHDYHHHYDDDDSCFIQSLE